MNDDSAKNDAPPQTPARLAAAAEASGIARMGKLRASLAAALRGALTSTDYEEFRACFPGFADDVALALHDLYRQVLHAARAHSEAEFEEICQDAGLLDALASAEGLTLAAEGGPAPGAVARGARVAAKRAEAARLRAALGAAREAQAGLDAQLRARRADAAAAAARFARVGRDLEPLAAAAARVVVD